jgi:hypothetical protein
VDLDPQLLNRAVWLMLDKPGWPLPATLFGEYPSVSRATLERVVEEAAVALSLACKLADATCGELYARECTQEAQDRVRALVPWMDSPNVELLVGRTIVNFYR